MSQDSDKLLMSLSDAQLGRLFLRMLWRSYDTGGVSYGRRLESKILEAAMELISPSSRNTDEITLEEMFAEAERRHLEKLGFKLDIEPED